MSQLDGNDSENNQSQPSSPRQYKQRTKSSTSYKFCDQISDEEDVSSLDWDSFDPENLEHETMQQPQNPTQKTPPSRPLNLMATPSKPINPNKVYRYEKMLDQMPDSVFKPKTKPQRKKPSKKTMKP